MAGLSSSSTGVGERGAEPDRGVVPLQESGGRRAIPGVLRCTPQLLCCRIDSSIMDRGGRSLQRGVLSLNTSRFLIYLFSIEPRIAHREGNRIEVRTVTSNAFCGHFGQDEKPRMPLQHRGTTVPVELTCLVPVNRGLWDTCSTMGHRVEAGTQIRSKHVQYLASRLLASTIARVPSPDWRGNNTPTRPGLKVAAELNIIP